MQSNELFSAQFQFIQRFFNRLLEGQRQEDLLWRPSPEANSLGFLLWHLLRTWDAYLSLVDAQEQTYHAGGWDAKAGFDVSGRGIADVGTGFTPEDVDIVRPTGDLLAGYFQALLERTDRYLLTATPAELDRAVRVPWWPALTTSGGVMAHIVEHSTIHLGGADYVKGLRVPHPAE